MIDAAELLADARATTGLNDFGDDTFHEGLERYCESLAAEAGLNEVGQVALPQTIVAALSNRLKVVDWHREHPEVADERIESPLIVIGLFRAGTTLLSYLLDCDPARRALLRWESGDSVPPPTPADHRAGPRVDAVRAANDMLEELNPRVRAIHHEEADGPTECVAVFSQDFKSLSWEAIANVPSYGTWLRATDHRSAYEYHRRVLQILQSGGVRGRWTLKSPHHAIALDALTAVYPDARLVLLHRDPIVLCASVCSLIGTLTATFTDADHRAYIVEHWTQMLDDSIGRIDTFRAAYPERPIVDVQYADLVSDPLGTIADMYAAVGEGLDAGAERAMRDYVSAHPKGALGTHSYNLAELGLDGAAITERFKDYIDRYEVPSES